MSHDPQQLLLEITIAVDALERALEQLPPHYYATLIDDNDFNTAVDDASQMDLFGEPHRRA